MTKTNDDGAAFPQSLAVDGPFGGMTPDQLAAIAARNAARTQGKWQSDRQFVIGTRSNADDQSRGMLIGHADAYGPKKKEDADFIAHASEDIPALLAEVARLQASLAEAEKRNVDLHRLAYSWMVAHDKLKAGKPYDFPSPLEPDAITKVETAAYQRGYDAAKEHAARIIDNLVAHLNLEQFLLVLRDKEKAAEISQAVIAMLEGEATAIRAMVRP